MGGKRRQENANEIASVDAVKFTMPAVNSALESADLVRKSKLVVSNDTGLMHIAAAYKRPVISLWGNTVPSFGMYPYYGENFLSAQQKQPYEILQVNKLKCRPCSKIGYDKCPKGHFKCMENIEVGEVLEAIHARL